MNGIGVTNSNSAGTAVRTRSTSSACSSAAPKPTTMIAQPGRKWSSAGTNGAGGALIPDTWIVSSGDSVGRISCTSGNTSGKRSRS